MSHSEVPQPVSEGTEQAEDVVEPSAPVTFRAWVRPAILTGMTLGAMAVMAINCGPTTVGGAA
jgi:hypothetical protein